MRKLGLAGVVVFLAILALPAAAAARTNENSRLERSELVAPGDVTGAIESWRDQVRQRAAASGSLASSTLQKQPWWSGNPPAGRRRNNGNNGNGNGNGNGGNGGKDDEGDDEEDEGDDEEDEGDDEEDEGDDEEDEGDDEEDDVSPSTPF